MNYYQGIMVHWIGDNITLLYLYLGNGLSFVFNDESKHKDIRNIPKAFESRYWKLINVDK